MPRYARIDRSAPEPYPVIGWYDTDARHYPGQDQMDLIEVSDDVWNARMADPSGWSLRGNEMLPPTPIVRAPLLPAEDTVAANAEKIAANAARIAQLEAKLPGE